MANVKRFLMVFLILLASCSTTPHVSINYTPSVKKLDMKIALIISEEPYVYETVIKTSCYASEKIMKDGVKGIILQATSLGTVAIEELFGKKLSGLFNKIDTYRDLSEIKNEEDYDYILFFGSKPIVLSYNEGEAMRRRINMVPERIGPFFVSRGTPNNLSLIPEGGPIETYVSVGYQLQVRDSKSKTVIGTSFGEGSSVTETTQPYCNGSAYAHVGEAMSNAFKDLLEKAEQEFISLAAAKSEERALPSDLSLSIRFSDTAGFFPNNTLDAGEDAEIIATIKNSGKGAGYGTNLDIASDNSRIKLDKAVTIGDIQPDETKEIRIILKTGFDLEDGKASFTFGLKEKRGYDAKKVVMNVPTARLQKPALIIVSTEINDGDTGLAKGNGNGIPESGETIEITAFIKNQGEGKALGVNLIGKDITSGILWERDSTAVGTIQPGEISKAKVAFSIPRNFDAKDITAGLKVGDMRGINDAEKKISVAYAKRSPSLQYAYRILSKGTAVTGLANGEEYEIELTVDNKGKSAARGVNVSVSPAGQINLSGYSSISFGDIKENESASRRIAFSLSRIFSASEAEFKIEIAQSDFPAVKDAVRMPVNIRSPKLTYTASLQGKSGSALEQGESAVVEIIVSNQGNLSAEGVNIKVASKDENLRIAGQTEIAIGKIPGNAKSETVKLPVSTLRRIKPGDALLDVSITQDDFPSLSSQYAINIKEEGAAVVDVFTSSAGKQISSWYREKQHGLFTYYFLQGIRGKADANNDGKVTVKEMDAYLGKNVSEQARVLHNREQTPEVAGDKDAVVARYK
ncbi:MAG: hypothetical protein HY265_04345 [Deltaproteobacteria bacterium]|nr:hypothetical protein [Deltaproteobacteria bacterium]